MPLPLKPSDLKAHGERLLERSSALISTSLDKLLERIRTWTHGRRPTFGLALCGGSARGLAYVGVFRFLEEHHVCPDIIAGTSVGALMGALYADGYSSQEIYDLTSQMGFMNMTSLTTPRLSLLKTNKYRQFLTETLRHKRIEELPIPLHIIATNLNRAEARDFTEGDLASAVVTSCSIPILFDPIVIEGEQYVDGGVFMNLPARPIREACDFLLGIDLSPEVDNTQTKNILRLSDRIIHIMMRANAAIDIKLCDVVLQSPILSRFSPYDVSQADIIADIGYQLISKAYQEQKQFREIIDLLSQESRR